MNNFKSALLNEDWTNVYLSRDTDLAFEMFSKKLNDHFESNFKYTRASRKSMKYHKPWLTPAIKKCINKKCVMYKKWIETQQHEDEMC